MGSSDAEIQLALSECNATEGAVTGQPCQPGWFVGEIPQKTIFVDDFEINLYEITNAQYSACVGAGVCQQAGRNIAADSNLAYDPGYFSDNYPVVGVSWHDANTYCNWVGGRLPSEAEWEKAARGDDGRRYPWGNTFDPSKANLDTGYPSPIGNYPGGASPYQIMDMAGNVFEWTATANGGNFVLRGGGWSKYYFRGRTADCGTQLPPDYANYDIGFRCAR
jgi:formylglycine-generating enzyme required for sulfatase activity